MQQVTQMHYGTDNLEHIVIILYMCLSCTSANDLLVFLGYGVDVELHCYWNKEFTVLKW